MNNYQQQVVNEFLKLGWKIYSPSSNDEQGTAIWLTKGARYLTVFLDGDSKEGLYTRLYKEQYEEGV